MAELSYTLTFTGKAAPEDEMGQRMTVEAVAEGAAVKRFLAKAGIDAQPLAAFSSIVENLSEESFDETGTVSFGDVHSLSFTTVGTGTIGPSLDPTVQQGAVVWRIDGGTGAFDGASGLVTSLITVNEDAVVTDRQRAVIFLP